MNKMEPVSIQNTVTRTRCFGYFTFFWNFWLWLFQFCCAILHRFKPKDCLGFTV